MPTEELDNAVQYVVSCGYIRVRTDTMAWKDAAALDISTFISALAGACPNGNVEDWTASTNPPKFIQTGGVIGSSLDYTGGSIFVNSNTSIELRMQFVIQNDNSFHIIVKNGACKYDMLISPGGAARPCYWAILRGDMGELAVVLGYDADTNLNSISNPNDFSGDHPVDIKNNLCRYTTVTFFMAHVADSLYNTTGYCAVMIPCPPTGPGSSTPYEASDEFAEFETYIDVANIGIDTHYRRQLPSGSYAGYMPKYYMVAGDNVYYAKNHEDSIPITLFSYLAPTYNLVPAYSPMSRCVSVTTLMETWGGMPDPNGSGTTGVPHLGPESIEIGSSTSLKHFIRSGNIFMPVTPSASPDPEPDPEDDD